MKNNALYDYVIVIKNQHQGFIDIIGLLLSLGSAMLFTREMLVTGKWNIALLVGVVFIVGIIVYNLANAKRTDKNTYYSKALLVAALVWMKMPYGQWLLFVFIILALLEYQAKLSLEIGFSRSEIVFNSLIKRRYTWSDLNNVVLKDGMLTIDFKSNKLFQKLIDDGDSEATEEEFNEWVKEINREGQLEKAQG